MRHLMILVLALLPGLASALTLDRLGALTSGIDPESLGNGSAWQLTLEDVPVVIITDAANDRMRAMVPIRSADGLTRDELERMMQANFDSVLDARYAIARGRLWSVFIHPLGALEEREFLAALGQVVNAAVTYGGAFTSGGLTFGGGDSNDIHRDLIERLLEQGERI